MGRHADRQRHRTLGAASLARLDGTLDGRRGTGDHHLAGRVEVHRTDHFTLRGVGAGGQHIGVFQAEDGGHAALPRRNGLLHQLATTLHQLHRIGEGQAAGSHQGGVFAQAVAGDVGRTSATFSQPQAPQGDGGGEDGGLGLVGLVELFFRTLLGQGPEVVAERLGGFGKGIQDQLLLAPLLGQHAQRLGALTGEDESEGCGHWEWSLIWRYREIDAWHSQAHETDSWMTGCR
ncbi:hypothetical protein FQZ97_725980 [compost metagenome]